MKPTTEPTVAPTILPTLVATGRMMGNTVITLCLHSIHIVLVNILFVKLKGVCQIKMVTLQVNEH